MSHCFLQQLDHAAAGPAHWTRTRFRTWPVLALSLLAITVSNPASAETLTEAFVAAYRFNPSLDAARARLRATDENVARANSAYRPRLEANGFAGPRKYDQSPTLFDDEEVDVKGYQLTVRQPIFRGFRTLNGVRQAEALSASGQENLKTVEARTLLAVVTAYADTMRDQTILALRRDNIKALSGEVKAARARLAAEDATKADVAQAEARTARAEADAQAAEAALDAAQAAFEEVVGHRPGGLSSPGRTGVHLLPPSRDAAIARGIEASPVVLSAVHRETAAQHNVNTILGELLPEVSVEGTWNQVFDPEPGFTRLEEGTVVGRVRVPLYQGGEVSARVRQAKQEQQAALQDVRAARAAVQTSVIATWARLSAARARVAANQTQARAAATAVTSIREEQKIGARTVLDVLNAQQELIDAKAAIATSERDVLVAGFEVLAEIGLLTIADLGLDEPVYEPAAHLDAVRHQWIGTAIAQEPGRAGLISGELTFAPPAVETMNGEMAGETPVIVSSSLSEMTTADPADVETQAPLPPIIATSASSEAMIADATPTQTAAQTPAKTPAGHSRTAAGFLAVSRAQRNADAKTAPAYGIAKKSKRRAVAAVHPGERGKTRSAQSDPIASQRNGMHGVLAFKPSL